MVSTILIIILSFLVLILSALIIHRRTKERGLVKIQERALNRLLEAISRNARSGNAAEIAGLVERTLQEHLKCRRLLYLKQAENGRLEPDRQVGLDSVSRSDFRFRLNGRQLKKLCSFHGVARVNDLGELFPERILDLIRENRLEHFFPVYLRRELFGVYLLRSDLSDDEAQLNFIATTLAFNLGLACHIDGLQRRLRISEGRSSRRSGGDRRQPEAEDEMFKYLRLRNCRQLVPELINLLRRECDFSAMGFYVRTDSSEEPLLSINWNLDDQADEILKEAYDDIIGQFGSDRVIELELIRGQDVSIAERLRNLNGRGVSHMISIPWVDRKKALLAWGGRSRTEHILNRLRRFEKKARPIVETVRRLERAEALSYTDGLTGTFNFRYFTKRLYEEFQRARRYKRFLALVIFDVDDLKMVNDRFGHQAGDRLLRSFSRILRESVRSNDIISRYGGDEFCLIMPEVDREHVGLFMERIRHRIAAEKCPVDTEIKLSFTVSIGGAVFPDDAKSIDGLIHAADMALLVAKEAGRNCSRLFLPEFKNRAKK